MNDQQPKRCVQCRFPLSIVRGLPQWMKEPGMQGGSYGGPLNVPQCGHCGAPAYLDARGWHIQKRKTGDSIFSVSVRG